MPKQERLPEAQAHRDLSGTPIENRGTSESIGSAPDRSFDSIQARLATFNQCVARHQGLFYSTALRILQNRQDAEDAVQQGLLKAFAAYATFNHGNLRNWVLRIITNTCLDMLRSRRYRQRSQHANAVDDFTDDTHPQAIELVDPKADLSQHLEQMELRAILEAAIARLNEKPRVILILCDIHEFKYEEVAEILNIPLGTVKSQLSRARATVRDTLRANPFITWRS